MFYTYLWLREDGTPYYVGKGKGVRAFINCGHNVHCPPEDRIIVQHYESEENAFEAEEFLIAYYGRRDLGTGYLYNRTDGGENPPPNSFRGYKHSAETIEKLKVWASKNPSPYMGRVGSNNHMWGKTTSVKQKEAVRAAALGNKHCVGNKNAQGHRLPEETKRAIAAKVKALWSNPEYREHMVQVHKRK